MKSTEIKESLECLEIHIENILHEVVCMSQTLEHCRDRYGLLLNVNNDITNNIGEAFRAIEKLKKIKRKLKPSESNDNSTDIH